MNGQDGWEQTLNEYGVDTVLLPVDTPLASALKESRRWRPVYDDGMQSCSARRPRSPGPGRRGAHRASAAIPDGRDKRGREITNVNPRDPRITKSNTRSEPL